jgi:predicted small secreted protein
MRTLLLTIPMLALALGIAGCQQEGPAERTGSSLDKAGQKLQDTVDPPQGPAQSAGRKLDRALGND